MGDMFTAASGTAGLVKDAGTAIANPGTAEGIAATSKLGNDFLGGGLGDVINKVSDMNKAFETGQNATMGDAYKDFGNNPQTYGYLYNKLKTAQAMTGGGEKQQAAPITMNISNPSPQQTYDRYAMLYGRR